MFRNDYKTLIATQIKPTIICLTLNRPAARNAINSEMMLELKQFWEEAYIKKNAVRCIILTGAAPAFCSGADLKERLQINLTQWHEQHAIFEQAMLAMIDCPIPIIAAVNGAAFGGGLELTLACDFAYAADNASFSQSEVKIGLTPGALGTQNLPRACGLRRAKELAFTGAIFDAQQAEQWGIINKVFSSGELMQETMKVAEQIAANAPLAIRQTKKAMNMSQHLDLKTGFMYELEAYYQVLPTEDREEGIRAFNEKRMAKFTGK